MKKQRKAQERIKETQEIIAKTLKKHNKILNLYFANRKECNILNLSSLEAIIKKIKPKKSILTNLHVDLDYFKLKKELPKNIIPAYDGLSFNF